MASLLASVNGPDRSLSAMNDSTATAEVEIAALGSGGVPMPRNGHLVSS
jgi:hypothetical protein